MVHLNVSFVRVMVHLNVSFERVMIHLNVSFVRVMVHLILKYSLEVPYIKFYQSPLYQKKTELHM